MREKLDIIAENLHLKGPLKYIVFGLFCVLILFLFSKILSIKPQVNNKKEEIIFALKGDKVVTLFEYDTFVDLGVIAKDEYGNDISSNVYTVGSVDTNTPGIYDILYKLNINGEVKELERTYVVVKRDGAYIELLGSEVINLALGSEYIEPGYTAIDYVLGDVTENVVVTNNVDTKKVGTYIIKYDFVASNKKVISASRVVKVNEILPSDLSFSLLGDTVIELLEGKSYVEPGYKAIDDLAGDISDRVIVSGNVDTSKKGTYMLKYVVTNDSGVQKVLYRTVNVYSKEEGMLTFNLKGSQNITIEQSKSYVEPGYSAFDTIDGDITSKVKVSGKVYIHEIGTYTLTYEVVNSSGIKKTLTRTINVVAPRTGNITLILKGSSPYYVDFGSKFVDPFIVASDSIDGDITSKVKVSGGVNTSVAGTYTVVYTVTNSTGVSKSISREVIVSKDLTLTLVNATKGYTKGNVQINVLASGGNFSRILLPDGSVKTNMSVSYDATQNGDYYFRAYTNSGKYVEKSITVSNIDREAPVGTCAATIKTSGNTYVKTNITDSGSGIKGIKYVFGSYSTNILSNTSYTYSSTSTSVSVVAYDNVDNEKKIVCSVVREESSSGSGSGSISGTTTKPGEGAFHKINYGKILNVWIYAPNDYQTSKKALIVFLHGSGEIGNNTDDFKSLAFYKYVKNGLNFDAVIIMPQLNSGKWYDSATMVNLKKLIDDTANKYNVDKSRISITGHSLGAIGTYAMLEAYPNYFSAAAPISGRWDTSSASALAKTPIWAFHGLNDTSVLYEKDKNLIDAVIKAGGNAKLTTFNDAGHSGMVDRSYKQSDVITWLITSKR